MWYPSVVTVAPDDEPITLEEAKAQTRVDGADDDASLTAYIAGARAHAEAYCGTPFVSRTISVKCDGFGDFAQFPVVPVSAVSAIGYVDAEGETQILDASVYELRADGLTAAIALAYGATWPAIQSGSRITVTANVGYAAVPDDIKLAILLLVGHWHKYREAGARETGNGEAQEIPHGVNALLCNHRVYSC